MERTLLLLPVFLLCEEETAGFEPSSVTQQLLVSEGKKKEDRTNDDRFQGIFAF